MPNFLPFELEISNLNLKQVRDCNWEVRTAATDALESVGLLHEDGREARVLQAITQVSGVCRSLIIGHCE